MAESHQITKLPPLTADHLDTLMAERLCAVRTDKTVIPMLWQGILELRIRADGQERTAKYYIPKDTPQGTAIVVMNIPEREQTLPFLEKSGWMELADQQGFCLFVLEPGPNGWGSPDHEAAYFRAAVNAELLGQYCLTSFAFYAVGYGSIGTELHKVVMSNPLHTAAAVFLDAGSVNEAYRKEYENKQYLVKDSFDPAAEEMTVSYRNIPVPVWIASGAMDPQATKMVCYWKAAAKAGVPLTDDVLGQVYLQDGSTEYTPEGNILKVAVKESHYDYCSKSTSETIYGFLKQYYRYGMGPRSNMISKRADFKAMGVEHRYFKDGSGIEREYLVYVPAAYRDGKKKLPAVIAYHGASQSMRNMMANGLWYEIADREGIILVYPESTLNPMPTELNRGLTFAYRPLWALNDPAGKHTEAIYADELLNRVIDEFPVDQSRIYCTGHSMGCMMTNYLGSDVVSHRFAAMGATSGCLKVREFSGSQPIPMFMTMGQFDLWSYLVSEKSPVTAAIDMWLERDGLAAGPEIIPTRTSGASSIFTEGRFHNLVWKDAAGIPWVRYAWISQKHHVHTPDENHVFWNQWFSRWHIDENGIRQYEKNRS